MTWQRGKQETISNFGTEAFWKPAIAMKPKKK
jgi:hypothetical protein